MHRSPSGHPTRPSGLRTGVAYAHQDRSDLAKLLRMCELKCTSQPGEVHRLLSDLSHRVESSGDSVLQTKWLVLKAITSLELSDSESATLHLRAAMLSLNEFESLSELRTELIAELEERQPMQHQTWESFRQSFEQSHPYFMMTLMSKCPTLSPMEVKICSLLRASVSTKEIAEIVSITKRAIENHRYHIRRKLGLGTKDNLTAYLMCM
ncbi:MAG TPA: helix-turn-helix transcriptional regulator [Candidatus Kapabacteria bacterium]|nr:helix-turn-helix transcriptional regulator [Candidatus Kapabacteria bacterium]